LKKLSIIVPAYNEEETVGLFYDAFSKVESQMDVEPEIIFVDDGSKDKTLIELKKLQKEHEEVHYISFSRNFGKEAALYAGLQKATGDFVAVMDVDLTGSSGTYFLECLKIMSKRANMTPLPPGDKTVTAKARFVRFSRA
jgi:glycosyltransferase involved in cell wall biosynthesis